MHPEGAAWDKAVAQWKTLFTDAEAKFDKEITLNAADITPMITYGTNPGMGIGVNENIPTKADNVNSNDRSGLEKNLWLIWDCRRGQPIKGQKN